MQAGNNGLGCRFFSLAHACYDCLSFFFSSSFLFSNYWVVSFLFSLSLFVAGPPLGSTGYQLKGAGQASSCITGEKGHDLRWCILWRGSSPQASDDLG
jgi:hypothetical protein